MNVFLDALPGCRAAFTVLTVVNNLNGESVSALTFPLLGAQRPSLHFYIAVVMVQGALDKVKATNQLRPDFIDSITTAFKQ